MSEVEELEKMVEVLSRLVRTLLAQADVDREQNKELTELLLQMNERNKNEHNNTGL